MRHLIESLGKLIEGKKTPTNDGILDFAATVCGTEAAGQRRDAALARAHAAGDEACEICGKAIKAGKKFVVAGVPIGPTCAKKMRKAGLIN